MRGNFFKFEAFEFARRNVVENAEQKGIDDMPTVDGEFRILNRALGNLHTRLPRTKRGAVASELQWHASHTGARCELRQHAAKHIVAFDYIRIAFLYCLHELLENLALRAGELLLPITVIAKLDSLQGVVSIGDYRQLHPVELIEAHPFERRAPGRHQMLLDGVVDCKVSGRAEKFPCLLEI